MTDPSDFWSFVRDSRGHSRIPGVMSDGQRSIDKPQDIVNAFAQHFGGVYDTPCDTYDFGDVEDDFCQFISIGEIKEDDIVRASKKLSNKRTAGLDEIPSFMVKDSIGAVSASLARIFNLSTSTGIYPSVWKRSKIIPVLKKGEKYMISKYRPISILSNFS
ncbi:uncharacterized protein LOC123315884 [Coccinella septempunctata]|uniref:uncharacterized protein LOC123315884 n=1 Tax=Coccinella septempunctata TaxID=41139 RepID=UPI001D07521F|nr:uncharacterized protein LOC123315884 [Coccinella septempunctata]